MKCWCRNSYFRRDAYPLFFPSAATDSSNPALGVGIAMCASLSHRLFAGEGLKVWIIETANDAINLTIAGAIIASFN